MNKPSPPPTRPRRQFRLGSLMAFTAGICVVSAILAALKIHPWQGLVAVVLFSLGVALVAAQMELSITVGGTRERQRREADPRRR